MDKIFKLQGVIILRISDMKRFFELSDFLNHKSEFIEYVDKKEDVFFDNEDQKILYKEVKKWLNGNELTEEKAENAYQDAFSKIYSYEKKEEEVRGYNYVFDLGRLKGEISKYEKHRGKLTGLTYLYLMLDAQKTDSEINLQYDLYLQIIKGVNTESNVEYLDSDKEYEYTPDFAPPVNRKYIVNESNHNIIIYCGDNQEELEPNECVVGLFCGNQCYRLLPHKESDEKYTMTLFFNKETKEPYLIIDPKDGSQKRRQENVCSIKLEKGGKPVFLTTDGEVHDYDDCYQFRKQFEDWKKDFPNEKTLAFILKTNYCFYSENKKSTIFD